MVSGVNTCHQPFLTLQNYWAELCFLQPAQQVPLPGSLQELQHLSAVLEGAVGRGAAEPQGTNLKFLSRASNQGCAPRQRTGVGSCGTGCIAVTHLKVTSKKEAVAAV